MMKPGLSLAVCIVGLVSLFLVFPAAFAQDRPSVSSVTLHRDDDGQDRIRIKLVGTHSPQVFTYNGDNPRLICDFPGAGYANLIKPIVGGEGTLVRGIRVGVHNAPAQKVRVVLDLQPGRKYTYSREFNKEENILNIVLVPTAGAKKAEDAVVQIDVSKSKQIVTAVPKDVRHKLTAPKETAPAEPPPTAADAAPTPQPPPVAAAGETKKPVAPTAAPASQAPPVTAAAAQETTAGKAAGQPAAPAKTPAPAAKAVEGDGKPAATVAKVPPPAAPAKTPAPAAKADQAEDAAPSGKSGEPAPAKPLLQEISYENSSSKGEMIFFRLNGFFPPTVSAVESGEPQIVCDFIGMALEGDVAPVIEARGAYVRKIVTTVDKDPQKIKVILDLTAGRDYDLRQVFFKDNNLFVLIVNALDEERAAKPGDDGAR